MRLYIGITDWNWFSQLSAQQPDEVNFWKPGGTSLFRALEPGGLFLFKLHSPRNFIAGGAFFVSSSLLPASLAWDAFGKNNGVEDRMQLLARIRKYNQTAQTELDPTIGCIILSQPFWLTEREWIPAPADWPMNTVQGKTYSTDSEAGARLYASVRDRLNTGRSLFHVEEEAARYGAEYVARGRLGQGAFRILVTDAYSRRCAISGEKTLPVLQAAHIKPFSQEGLNAVTNGLLLRSDLHTLFDLGFLTVTPEHVVEVSCEIKHRFENGREYYAYHGSKVKVLPRNIDQMPGKENLLWHNENVFVA